MSIFEILRERIDLAELAGRYTELTGSGNTRVGRCPHPNHGDRNPSFHVYPDRRFHCFGCGWHGDITDLWAATNGLESSVEAALSLARERGVELSEVSSNARESMKVQRQKEAENSLEVKKYHEALERNSDVAEWWDRRGFDGELRQRFLLGARGEGKAIIPFWNRGRVQGFILRNMEGGKKKYMLQKAEKFVTGYRPLFIPGPLRGGSFLVEGYVDALALVALGYSAIAVGGTSVSQPQMEELLRLPGPLYILPDADEAGAKAAREWAEKLYPKALLCPPGYEKEEGDD